MKKIKNAILLTFAIAIAACTMASCAKSKEREAQEKLAKLVENVETPSKGKDGKTLIELRYEDNVLTYVKEVSADTLAGLKKEDLEKQTLENLQSGMKNRKWVKLAIEANAEIEYVYKSGNDSVVLRFEPADLQ